MLTRFALLAFATVPLAAQSPAAIAQSDFDNPTYNSAVSMGGPNLLVGIRLTAAASYTATRLEVFTGNQRGTNTLAIWSHDPNNNQPLAPLGQGSWTMSAIVGWQGANLATPVPLTAGQTFWLVWGPINGAQSSTAGTGAGAQPYRGSFDGGLSWNGPFQSQQWKLRIWTGTAGHYEAFGSGCSGGSRTTPELGWDGVPNLLGGGNTVLLDRAPANDFALLTVGDSDTTFSGGSLPFALAPFGAPSCNLLTSVGASVLVFTDATGRASHPIAVPMSGTLLGFRFFDQWFVHDATANALGFKVSNGGVGTIGL